MKTSRQLLFRTLLVVLLLVDVMAKRNGRDRDDDDRNDDDRRRRDDDDDDDDDRDSSRDESEHSPMVRRLWIAHGTCAATAWGLLVPLAVSSSLLRKFLEANFGVAWFPIHRLLNGTAIVLTVVAVALAVTAYSYDDDEHFVDEPHHFIGLLIGLGCVFQGINGLLRPHLPHAPAPPPSEPSVIDDDQDDDAASSNPSHADDPDAECSTTAASRNAARSQNHEPDKTHPTEPEPKSTARILWEYLHKSIGFTLLLTSWWQVQSGLYLFADEMDGPDLRVVFFAVIGFLTGTVLLLYGFQSTMT